jgi:holo-[acyl-carrier protein] synthase
MLDEPNNEVAPDAPDAPSVILSAAKDPAESPSTGADVAAIPPTPDAPPVAGLGVDIIEIDRMERILARTPRMITRVFSEGERTYAQSKARPSVHFALFFAAKEAVLKALGTGFAGIGFTDVEVGHDRYGRPVPLLHGPAQELVEQLGVVEIQLSLSYTQSVGVASAVAIKEQDRPRRDEKVDPRVELARQFKEMRAMLDDMDDRIKSLDEDPPVKSPGEEPPVKSLDEDPPVILSKAKDPAEDSRTESDVAASSPDERPTND